MRQKNTTLDELRQFGPIVALYALTCTLAGKWIFWLSFSINPFPYLGVSDLLPLSADTLLVCTIYALFILTLHSLGTPEVKRERNWHRVLQFRAVVAIILIPMGVYFALDTAWLHLPAILISTWLITPLIHSQIISDSFSSIAIKTTVAFLVVTIPTITITSAYQDARNIKATKGQQTIIKRPTGMCSTGCILIGRIGSYFSVMGKNGKVFMLATDQMKTFEIYKSQSNQ